MRCLLFDGGARKFVQFSADQREIPPSCAGKGDPTHDLGFCARAAHLLTLVSGTKVQVCQPVSGLQQQVVATPQKIVVSGISWNSDGHREGALYVTCRRQSVNKKG